jgi:hypothetical protein
MNTFWQSITAWFKAHNWTSKTLLAAIPVVAYQIIYNTQVHAFVLQTFQSYPKIGAWIVSAATLYLALSSPHSDAGTLAKANAIKDQPNAPTAEQVSAATPQK